MNKFVNKARRETPSSATGIDCDDVTMLAHDLRGFLHAIKTSVYVLRASRPNDAELSEMLDIIERDHDHVLPRLNELIGLARHHDNGERLVPVEDGSSGSTGLQPGR